MLLLLASASPSVYSQPLSEDPGINATNSINNFLTYEDPGKKYTISYPSDWSPDDLMPGSFHPNEYYNATITNFLDLPSFDIFSGLDSSRTFDDVVEYYKNLHANDNLTESETIELRGNPAYKLVYDSTSGSKIMEIRTRTHTPDDFTFTYTVVPKYYERYLPIIQRMIDSFKEIQPSTS